VTKDAIEAEVRRFFIDDRISAVDAQLRLVATARALSKPSSDR
jgi:glucose/mannose transport system substrate-binding protein